MSLLKTLLFSVFATKAAASCAYGTHLLPRAEGGETVEIKDFGYSGGRVRETIYQTEQYGHFG